MRKYLWHSCFWVVFFLMWNQIMYFYISNLANRVYFSMLDVSLIALTFYIIYLFLMPGYLKHKKPVRLILLAAMVVIFSAAFFAFLMGLAIKRTLVPINFEFSWNYKDLQYNRFFIALLGVLGGAFVKLAVDRLEAQRVMENFQKEKTLAELTYLKAQINPHFLFNALNGLYTQLDFDTPAAKNTLVAIADLLRYQLYECNGDHISLRNEIAYLENYFNLQKMRNDNCIATFSVNGDPGVKRIAPLLLIPFVENAFKHVSDHDDRKNIVEIVIDVADEKFSFFCLNSIDPEINQLESASGIGLLNVKKRLDIIYRGGYEFSSDMPHGFYKINLSIDLK